eukprot:508857-Prymnesium_polylepis.2
MLFALPCVSVVRGVPYAECRECDRMCACPVRLSCGLWAVSDAASPSGGLGGWCRAESRDHLHDRTTEARSTCCDLCAARVPRWAKMTEQKLMFSRASGRRRDPRAESGGPVPRRARAPRSPCYTVSPRTRAPRVPQDQERDTAAERGGRAGAPLALRAYKFSP